MDEGRVIARKETKTEKILGDTMAGKTDVVESEASGISMEALAAAVASIANSVSALNQKVDQLATRPQTANALSMAPTRDQLFAGIKDMQLGEQRQGTTFRDRFGRAYQYTPNTVVELTDETKLENFRSKGLLGPDQSLRGVVESVMYWRKRDNCPKYKVYFGAGFGSDGLMENQMRRV